MFCPPPSLRLGGGIRRGQGLEGSPARGYVLHDVASFKERREHRAPGLTLPPASHIIRGRVDIKGTRGFSGPLCEKGTICSGVTTQTSYWMPSVNKNTNKRGWGHRSVVKHVLSLQKTLCSILGTAK